MARTTAGYYLMKVVNLVRLGLEYTRRHNLPTLTPSEVHARLGKADFFVFDCNLESLWERSHIPGATYIGFEQFGPEVLPQNKQATLVFYCACHL
jgi:rhodanese-related sulfurtransferase